MQSTEVNGGKSKNTARAQLTRLILRLEKEEKKDLGHAEPLEPEPAPVESARQPYEQRSRNAMACGAVSLTVVFSLLALLWMWRDFPPAEAPEWQPVFALAEVQREKGELYDAKALYSQAGRFAAARDDWIGLLSAACGLDKLENRRSRYSARDALLLRAMAAAEKKRTPSGMKAVARAFTLVGEHELAAVATSRIRQNWPAEESSAANLGLSGCWNRTAEHKLDLTGE